MVCSECMYIISLSLQVAGALTVFLDCMRKMSIKELAKDIADNKDEYGDLDEQSVNEEPYKEEKRNIWMNRTAFFEIAIGYLLSIFGELNNTSDRGAILLLVIILSSALLFVTYQIYEKKP